MLVLLKRLVLALLLVPYCSFGQPDSASVTPGGSWWDVRPSGLYNVTTFSVVTFSGQFLNGMQTIMGYRINPHLAVGGGIGLERFTGQPLYDTVVANLSLLPVFADFRYTILDRTVSPVISVGAGYKVLLNVPSTDVYHWSRNIFPGFLTNDYYVNDTYIRGGFFFTVEAGVRGRVWKRFSLCGSVGYSWWSVSGHQNNWLYQTTGGTTKEYYESSNIVAYTHSFQVRVGFGF
jgi:hypothetical protein